MTSGGQSSTYWTARVVLRSGSVAEVERALDVLGVSRRRDEATGDIAHVGMVALLDGGRVRARVEGGWGQAAQLLAALPPLPH